MWVCGGGRVCVCNTIISMLSVVVFGYEGMSTSPVRPITPHLISCPSASGLQTEMRQVRGVEDGACTNGFTYYTQVMASGAIDGDLLRSVAASSRKQQQGCRETC